VSKISKEIEFEKYENKHEFSFCEDDEVLKESLGDQTEIYNNLKGSEGSESLKLCLKEN
tara:strand:+ start:207 stop:383 length:177 start_codon:yes stop_codon:yes gene_type:complete